MLINILFFVVVLCLVIVGMLALTYDRDYKSIKMPDIDEFAGMFACCVIVSLVFTVFLFSKPVLVLSLVGFGAVIAGAGFGIYRGLLRLKDYLDTRETK